MLNPRLQMQPATDSPLGRIRRGEPSPPPPKAEKPVSAKKSKAPKPKREPKGPITPPIMPTPCPADLTEAAVWHGTRLAIVLSKIPSDCPAGPRGEKSEKPPRVALVKATLALTKACGFKDTTTLKRGRLCFWGCMRIVSWFHRREKDLLLAGALLIIVAETFREELCRLDKGILGESVPFKACECEADSVQGVL